MRAVFRKLRNNLLNARAEEVLGRDHYMRFLGLFLRHLPRIAREGNMQFLDREVGRGMTEFNYRGRRVLYDCSLVDERIARGEIRGVWSFGYLREIFIRDCYFKHMPDHVFEEARVVLDLGMNCGIFSSLMATRAEFIVGVDVNAGFLPVVEENLRSNGLQRFALEHGYIGGAGSFQQGDAPTLTITGLMIKHGLRHIDLVKMDIEGSEYQLFKDDAWLARVGAVTMELHRGYPGLDPLLAAFERHGFRLILADQDLERVNEPQQAEFLYAWKPKG